MLPLAGAPYCLVVCPVLPSYMRINCLGLDPGGWKLFGSVRRVSWPSYMR